MTLPPLPAADDASVLAGELAAAFTEVVECYRKHSKLSQQEAEARAAESCPVAEKQALHGPPDQVTWNDLDAIARRDPALALQRWEEVKEAAREELRSGHRAARALEGGESHAWARARFLAIRAELAEGWGPRNGLEWQLVDQLAQLQTMLYAWQEVLAVRSMLAGQTPGSVKEGKVGPDGLARLTDAEALAGAADMVERVHGLYLRTLRVLQEQRRLGPRVVVRRAGQVNIAQQQVNVSG